MPVGGRIVRHVRRRAALLRSNQPGDLPVDIGELVAPLRYDIAVRADFFGFLDERLDLYREDFTGFAERARDHAYFRWYECVAMARFRPQVAADRTQLLRRYDQRLRDSYALWTSYRKHGFDPDQPVLLRPARAGAVSATGKAVARRLHAGDGCHRLAMLLAAGQRTLPVEWYRIDHRVLAELPDNTDRLLRVMTVPEDDYARFLSLGYTTGAGESGVDALVERVRAERPERLTELVGVLAVDRPQLGASR
jgi:hypothetical protein